MPPHEFGIPESYLRDGRYVRLSRVDRDWTIQNGDGLTIGTLRASGPELGAPEWYVVSEAQPEPDGYWPTWRLALNDFLEPLD